VIALLVVAGPARALEVRVLSSVGSDLPDDTEKQVRLGTDVTLHVAVASPSGWMSDVPRVRIGGQVLRARQFPRPPRVRWYRVDPVDAYVSNTDPSWHWAAIDYVPEPIRACDDRLSCTALVRSEHLGDRGGLGTMAFSVEVELGGELALSPGAESIFRGGLSADVHRVTVRRDDGYLGRLTELFNTPYIWGSAGVPDTKHQAERRIGSDCADFVTYGVRRLGFDVPYTSTLELHRFTRQLYDASASADGVYHSADGRQVPVGPRGMRPGDLLLFRGHVGAFVEDRPPLGVLNAADVMIHTCWAPPAEESLTASGWAGRPLRVLRWKVLENLR
jgi:cell wall-associated NlpC family hydrolase